MRATNPRKILLVSSLIFLSFSAIIQILPSSIPFENQAKDILSIPHSSAVSPSIVQQKSVADLTGGLLSLIETLTSPVGAGNILVAAISSGNPDGPAVGIKDSLHSVWSSQTGFVDCCASTFLSSAYFYYTKTLFSGYDTVNMTFSNTNAASMTVYELSGVATTNMNSSTGTGSDSGCCAVSSFHTGTNGGIVLAAVTVYSEIVTPTISAGAEYTISQTGSSALTSVTAAQEYNSSIPHTVATTAPFVISQQPEGAGAWAESALAFTCPTTCPAGTYNGLLTVNNPSMPISLEPRSAGLVAYWNMAQGSGTTLFDNSGNENSGTLVNSPTWSASNPYGSGESINFSANSDQYATITTSTILSPTTAISVTGWILLNSITINQYPIAKGTYGTNGWAFSIQSGNLLCAVGTATCGSATGVFTKTGDWEFIAFTYSTSTATSFLYLNATQEDTRSISPSLSGNANPFTIGVDGGGAGHYTSGKITDVREYSYALTAAQISRLYTDVPSGRGWYPSGVNANPLTYGVYNTTKVLASWNIDGGANTSFSTSGIYRGVGALTMLANHTLNFNLGAPLVEFSIKCTMSDGIPYTHPITVSGYSSGPSSSVLCNNVGVAGYFATGGTTITATESSDNTTTRYRFSNGANTITFLVTNTTWAIVNYQQIAVNFAWIPPVACSPVVCNGQLPSVTYTTTGSSSSTQLIANPFHTISAYVTVWLDNTTGWTTINPFLYNLAYYTPNATSGSTPIPKSYVLTYSAVIPASTCSTNAFNDYLSMQYVCGFVVTYGNLIGVQNFLAIISFVIGAGLLLKTGSPILSVGVTLLIFGTFSSATGGIGGSASSFLSNEGWRLLLLFLILSGSGLVYRLMTGRNS